MFFNNHIIIYSSIQFLYNIHIHTVLGTRAKLSIDYLALLVFFKASVKRRVAGFHYGHLHNLPLT